MTRLWIIWIMIFLPAILSGQNGERNESNLGLRFTSLEVSYGLGGIWYLNEIDEIPKCAFSIGHGLHQKQFDISLHAGIEFLEDVHFFPIMFRLGVPVNRSNFQIRVGYAFARSRIEIQHDHFEFFGGFAGDLSYKYSILKKEDFDLGLQLSYQVRKTQLEFEVNDDELESQNYYHHISFGVVYNFE